MKFNPFVPNGIAFPGMFLGRYNELSDIAQALHQTRNENPQHLLITGERGIGKSSLMNFADLVARGDIEFETKFNFLTVSTDLAGVTLQGGIVRHIARELRTKIAEHEALKARLKGVWEFVSKWEILGVSYKGRDELIDPEAALEELVTLLRDISQVPGFDGILILLDEADIASAEANLGEFVKIATERLAKRGVLKVMFALAGQAGLLAKLRESHESSVRIFQVLAMEPLETPERLQVIDQGLKLANEKNEVQTKIEPKAREMLAALSEGYPHFLQQFSHSAFSADRDDIITLEDVSEGTVSENGAIAQLGKKYFSEMYFSKIWSDDYRKVLDFMAQHGDNWSTRKEIIAGCGVAESSVNNALAALKKREIIIADEARKGYYRLPTRSFATWITVRNEAEGNGLNAE